MFARLSATACRGPDRLSYFVATVGFSFRKEFRCMKDTKSETLYAVIDADSAFTADAGTKLNVWVCRAVVLAAVLNESIVRAFLFCHSFSPFSVSLLAGFTMVSPRQRNQPSRDQTSVPSRRRKTGRPKGPAPGFEGKMMITQHECLGRKTFLPKTTKKAKSSN